MKIKAFLLLVLLTGCDPAEPLGGAGGKCRRDYSCQPGLQCQVNSRFSICVPIAKAVQ